MSEVVFTARVLSEGWGVLRIGVYQGDIQVGEYERNYSSFYQTFFPFERDGKWYALYSPDYTCTRLMELPSCKDIGGEEPNAVRFCPVEFLVPRLVGRIVSSDDPEVVVANHRPDIWAHKAKLSSGMVRYFWPDDKDHPHPDEKQRAEYLKALSESHAAHEKWVERNPFVEQFANWGFVAGCVWGDDSSWKIEYLDLSRVHDGIIVRDDRFGYIELPRGVCLKDAINTDDIFILNKPESEQIIEIAQPVRFRLDGRPV